MVINMAEYIIVGGELKHYGVKGMKWGQRRPMTRAEADLARKKAAYKSANKAYNKSFNKANNRNIAVISPFKKHRDANQKRWEDVVVNAKKANSAQQAYKKAKKVVKAESKTRRKKAAKERGKSTAQKMLMGKYGAKVYNQSTSKGYSKGQAFARAASNELVNNLTFGGLERKVNKQNR